MPHAHQPHSLDLEALPPSSLLTRKQVAQVIGFSEVTLKTWAREGRGPRITRIEGKPRFRVRDVQAWIGGDNG
ncbi:Helix-turn-helix domain-containing protein [Tranquillimonas alkanivorans]|uniref:Helix-turn-helix domain-containing protein n=2 Tax=Tranquillimonas alkanivorans TaxID=441119 RepID=A0A1I5PBQ5_9RHOB|nr:Helix-turn-helix domain-containing protein [Tranquillimonas alkanivorans]